MDIVFWGGTGQARVLAEALGGSDTRVVAVFDNRAVPSPIAGIPIFEGEVGFDLWLQGRGGASHGSLSFAVAIGGPHGAARLERSYFLAKRGLREATIVHPRAWIARDASLGPGCQALAGALVATCVNLGRQVIVNTGASIDHDGVVEDGAHIGPGAVVAGEVRIGACAFIGANATVLPRIRIGAGAIVGAGAVVTRDVAESTVVAGVPARPVAHVPPPPAGEGLG
jgi:sugar O-acyltransferase (sialic acid O-acetyltransferase NeuD family)